MKSGYLSDQTARHLFKSYDEVIGTLVGMINHKETWLLPHPSTPKSPLPPST